MFDRNYLDKKAHTGNRIVDILMEREGMSQTEAENMLEEVREWFDPEADDIEEVLMDEFGVEPDYIEDFLIG